MVWALVRAERYKCLLRLLYVEDYEDKGAADVVGTSELHELSSHDVVCCRHV